MIIAADLTYSFIYFRLHGVFLAVQSFSSGSELVLLFVVVHELLIAVASLAVGHRF